MNPAAGSQNNKRRRSTSNTPSPTKTFKQNSKKLLKENVITTREKIKQILNPEDKRLVKRILKGDNAEKPILTQGRHGGLNKNIKTITISKTNLKLIQPTQENILVNGQTPLSNKVVKLSFDNNKTKTTLQKDNSNDTAIMTNTKSDSVNSNTQNNIVASGSGEKGTLTEKQLLQWKVCGP